jgi:hypothetical protein
MFSYQNAWTFRFLYAFYMVSPSHPHWRCKNDAYRNIPSKMYAGFVVLTAMVMKSSIFWDITSCSPLKVNQHFGGKCRLHIQVLKRKFLAWLILRPWIWRWHLPPKRRLTFNGLYCVTPQKTELFRTYMLLGSPVRVLTGCLKDSPRFQSQNVWIYVVYLKHLCGCLMPWIGSFTEETSCMLN